MRFITEFELTSPFEIKNYKSLREKGTAEWLGLDISKAFGWQSRGETTLHGRVIQRHKIEIEAFPMDQWVEFKNKLFTYLSDTDGMVSSTRILQMFKDIESFGKPAGAEKQQIDGNK
jgi:hypothetical protein